MRLGKFSRLAFLAVIVSGSSSAFFAVPAIGAPTEPSPLMNSSEPLPFVAPKDLKWSGREGHLQTAVIFGDPNKPGPYGVLYKWFPGNFSKPHFHNQTRWGYVISGTWWVSSADVPDINTTYPMHAGTVVVDLANKVHWDGVRASDKEPAVVLVTGTGPVKTVGVDANGNALPPRH